MIYRYPQIDDRQISTNNVYIFLIFEITYIQREEKNRENVYVFTSKLLCPMTNHFSISLYKCQYLYHLPYFITCIKKAHSCLSVLNKQTCQVKPHRIVRLVSASDECPQMKGMDPKLQIRPRSQCEDSCGLYKGLDLYPSASLTSLRLFPYWQIVFDIK